MEHSVESLIMDLESSIFTPPTVEQLDAAQAILEKASRPPWDASAAFDDVEDIIAKGEAGEVLPVPFSRLSKGAIQSRETSTEEISAVCADVLRRLAGNDQNDFRKTDDREPDEEDENAEIPADDQVQADVAFLKSKQAEGVDLWDYTNQMLHTDLPRARELRKAIAVMGVV